MPNGHPIDAGISGHVVEGNGFNVTIMVDQTVTNDTVISLGSSDTSVVAAPATATVPANHDSVIVPFRSSPVASATNVTIYAEPGGATLPGGATPSNTFVVEAGPT